MTLNSLLSKIETGQVLSDKHEKQLAKKLWLIPSFFRSTFYVVLILAALLFILIGITDSLNPTPAVVSYLISIGLVLLLVYTIFVPRMNRLALYFEAVDNFYETKFKGLEHYDLYYIGQHKSPHVRALRSTKIYLLSNHQQFLFIDDYFKDTIYPLGKNLAVSKPVFLRVIDQTKTDQSRVSIEISEIDYFHLSSKTIPINKKPLNKKFHKMFTYFLDQDPHMDEYNFITLKLYNGAVFRISYDAYPALKNAIPLKEK
ncbi:MAG: hypothetical protein CVV63_00025 [Tenericutes bacterium HGW-Tenericutes-8]|nr:MAG: hypothetical protein CVV63_00025 [Tenericutes bacterium HGW-Tenericutes-8]